jgi:hypothetical protein
VEKVGPVSSEPRFNTISAALQLAEDWGLPVFPVRLVPRADGKTDKIPMSDHGLLDATTNIDCISKWWTQWPSAAVGVPTGRRTKIFLLDIDPDGDAWYRENAARLECGRIHKTSRGWHLIYSMPEQDVFNSAGRVAKGVDIRGSGGFMLWWPAVGGECIGAMEDIKPAPAWLLKAIAECSKAPVIPLHGDAPGMIGAGRRNDFISREAYRQRKLGGSLDQMLAVLSAINDARCDPPLDREELLAIVRGKAAIAPDPKPEEADDIPPIQAKPFVWRDPKTIPPRPWLYAKHYMRGMASATAGIGGAGKSTMLLTEAIGAACGFNLLTGEQMPVGPLRVWIHNGEDPPDELERRIAAILLHYSITDEALGGRLFVTSGREMPILVAEALSDGGKVFVPREDGALLQAELIAKKIDIFIADPFITIHRVNENDNGLIDSVMALIRNIAHQAQCAFEVAHHLRKLNGGDVGIDDIRGAGSIVGACRSVRLMAAMTQEEAQRYGIEEKDRKAFSWLVNGKANMLPPSHAREWVHTLGVPLDNAAAPYEQDNIGVLERWIPPESFLDLTPQEFHLIRRAIQEGRKEELRYDNRAKDWAGKLIANVLGKDITEKSVRAEMLGLIERWKKAGKLKVEDFHSARHGRSIAVIKWSESNIEAE